VKIKVPSPPWKKKLKKLVTQRKKLDDRIARLMAKRDILNNDIAHVLEKRKKTNVTIFGWVVMRVQPKTVHWNTDVMFKWYRKKKLPPPTKEIFDPEKLERDIKRGRVPAKMLSEFSSVEPGKEYVRIQKDA
jgi:hypothetical protein